MSVQDFYQQLTPFYHLIYPDWEASIERQAGALAKIIEEFWGDQVETILDAACGIGTQALGLAQLGYRLTASDLSSAEVERAKQEAGRRNLTLYFSVADMRRVYDHHRQQFDLVIACDNAVPHLLTDEDILAVFQQFYRCTHPGGGCLISVRDYDKEERGGVQVKPYGLRVEGQTRYLLFQVWEFQGSIYDLAIYFVEDRGGSDCVTHVMRTKYYAVGPDKLIQLMTRAGFRQVQRLDDRFFQPVIVGKKDPKGL
jgi:SAM-dependent methyltransferase